MPGTLRVGHGQDRAVDELCVAQIEGWFSLLSRRAIRRGIFRSVSQLVESIKAFITAWNDNRHPFVWVKTPDEILAKARVKIPPRSIHAAPVKVT